MSRFVPRVATAIAFVAFAAVASAGTGYVCHPDPSGTKTLRVTGSVEHYDMRDGRATLVSRDGSRCREIAWNFGGGYSAAKARCRALSGPTHAVRNGGTLVSLRSGSKDVPDHLLVSGPRGTRSWPLPERAYDLDVEGRTAVFSTVRSREVYAVDLGSGRAAVVGLAQRRDTPQLERAGLLFRDNLDKTRERDGTTLMKFIPRRHLDGALATVGRPLRVDGQIVDIAMDGPRVAFSVRRWHGKCDAVLFWNIAWGYSVPITEDGEHTCEWSRQGGSIGNVSIAGIRAAWTMRVGAEQRMLSASSIDCFERVVLTARLPRGERVLAHAGDGALLAYVTARADRGLLGRLNSQMRGQTMAAGGAPVAIAVDDSHVAVLNRGGTVQIRTASGDVLRTIHVGSARAIALRADLLAVLTEGAALAVFNAKSGARLASWPVPHGADASLDVHFGVAVVTAGRLVYAISTKSGKRVLIARAPAPVRAEIEAPGIAYSYNTAGRGFIKYVAFSRVERLLGLA